MNRKEILVDPIIGKYINKIYFDWDEVSVISLFDAALVLEIEKSNVYKLLKAEQFTVREIGGAKFVTVESLKKKLDERNKRKELIAFKKASMFTNTGVAPANIVKGILSQLTPEEKRKALQEILSTDDFQNFIQKSKINPQK
jgi:hypothetical protein